MRPTSDFPINNHLSKITELVATHRIVLLSSPPGTGKTTILPPFLLRNLTIKENRKIIMLEPRRIAAVRTAEFISSEYLEPAEQAGETVGYRVRGETKVSSKTKLEIQTYGVFNRIAASTIDLPDYDLIIFDEAHERSIDIDLALAQALEIQSSIRPDLKIIVMSATLNVDDLRTVAPTAPLVTVTTQTFPVAISYIPKSVTEERNQEAHVTRAVKSIGHREGDILIFLPGALEINRAAEALGNEFRDREVMKLFGELSLKEQKAILNPASDAPPRIILSSSIAETSLTVPRVRTVIDAGLSRVPRYDPERGLPGLETVRVSSSTAEQRAGRAGRLGPGACVRLWAEHEQLVRFRSPEILESDLTPLVLTLAAAGISDLKTLKWITQPSTGAVQAARDLLLSLNALTQEGRITEHGVLLQQLPVHPRLAHLILSAAELGQKEYGCILAAAWSEMRPSGHSTLDLNAITLNSAPASARELYSQLLNIVSGINVSKSRSKLATVSAAALFATAFPDRIAHKRTDLEYLLSGGSRATLPKDSRLAREQWLICPAVRSRPGSATALISAAAPVSESELRAIVPHLFKESRKTSWNESRKAVVMREAESLLALELKSRESPSTDPNAAAILLEHLSLKDLPLSARAESLIERAKWLHATNLYESTNGAWWEKLDDRGLTWLTDFISGATKAGDITEDAVYHALVEMAGGNTVAIAINKLAPETLTLPRGRIVSLQYSQQKAPVAASRLQDFFGIKTHPTVADGKVAIICELLSPARRPIQITDDLPRFWQGSYAEVRKDLKSRYPKHDWPERP